MKRSDQIDQLTAALALARKEFKEITKNKTVKVKGETKQGKLYEYGYDYADYPNVLECTTEALCKNDLTVSQGVRMIGNTYFVVTTLSHKSGQWIETEYPIIPKDNTMQGFGGGYTYARRFAYNGIVNVSAEDDTDGQTTNADPKNKIKTKEPNQPNPPPQNQPPKGAEAPKTKSAYLSDAQIARAYALAKKATWSEADFKKALQMGWNRTSIKEMNKTQYDELCNALIKGMPVDRISTLPTTIEN